MPFAAEDVYLGMIAYFRIDALMRNGRIRNTVKRRDTFTRGENLPDASTASVAL